MNPSYRDPSSQTGDRPTQDPSQAAGSRSPGAHWLAYALAVAVISILVAGLATMALWQEKQRYRERASVATQNISRLLDQHISDVMDKIDVVLQATVAEYGEFAVHGNPDPARLNAYLAKQQALLPEVAALRILDQEGIVRFGNGLPKGAVVSLRERTFFNRARSDSAGSLVITGPALAPINQEWVIVFARRITAADGSFAGVAYALLPTTQFEKIFSSLALGPYGAATIRTADLALVHRHPAAKNGVGSKDVSRELRERVQANPEGGEYLAATALDGIERSNSYRKLQRYPFYVLVGLATDDYMGGWWNSVLMFSGLAGLTILAVGLAAVLVYRSARRQAAEISRRKEIAAELEGSNQALMRSNQELQHFAHVAAHDLQTPLRSIAGFAQLLQRDNEGKLSEQSAQWISRVVDNAKRMQVLIQDLLSYSRLGAQSLPFEPVDLKEVFDAVMANLAEPIRGANAEVSCGELPTLAADRIQMVQVLQNLIENGIKYNSSRPPRVRVAAERRGEEWVFSVADNGIGIEPKYHQRIFEIFRRLHSHDAYTGSGVGLAICQRVVERHGGRLWVESEEGQGSVFFFTLPARTGNSKGLTA